MRRMRRKGNDIIMTTAHEIQGAELTDYQDVLFSTAVIGTGFLSEMMAGFSDSFGARSGAFERKIDQAREYVLSDLKEQARLVGSNCLIGLTFSLNEISSGQKNMFMISAGATPVTMRMKTKEIVQKQEKKFVRKDEILYLLQSGVSQEALHDAIHSDKVSVEPEVSAFCLELAENGSTQAEKELAQLFVELSARNKTFDIPTLNSAFDAVDGDLLFAQFLEQAWGIRYQIERIPAFVRPSNEIARLYQHLEQYPDYQLIGALMKNNDIAFETLVLVPLLQGVKEVYSREDLDNLKFIFSHLTTMYWPADPSLVSEQSRITADGQILPRSGSQKTISASTFRKRYETAKYLDQMIKSLDRLFQTVSSD